MGTVEAPRSETKGERFERLCVALDMAAGLPRDDAYQVLCAQARTLPKRSKLAKWYLGRCLAILDDFVPPTG